MRTKQSNKKATAAKPKQANPLAKRVTPKGWQDAHPAYPGVDLPRLLHILSLRRRHGSKGESRMCEEIITPYSPELVTDEYGDIMAYVLTMPRPDGTSSTTLWSCHVDTVHGTRGEDGPTANAVEFDPTSASIISLSGECLGADDGAGVWLLLELYDAGVPGTYIFHRGEEVGGIGSRYIAQHHIDLLQQHSAAIAFDRRGTSSIITHQSSGRCCSDAFARSLASMLNPMGLTLAADDGGIYTDTAEYIHDIPECTNISCGYYSEHGSGEHLDVAHLVKLRNAFVVGFREDDLVIARDVNEVEPYGYGGWWDGDYCSGNYGGGCDAVDDDAFNTAACLYGKTRKQIAEELDDKFFEELVDIIYALTR